MLTTVAISAFFWLVPLEGFAVTAVHPELSGLCLLAGWYLTIVLAARVGYELGGNLPLASGLMNNERMDIAYLVISALATVGVMATLQAVSSVGVSSVIDAFTNSYANSLKSSLYEDYSAGIYTLRYASILASAIAIYRLIFGRVDTILGQTRYPAALLLLDIWNVLMLLLSAAIASRLSVICCIAIVGYLASLRGTLGLLRNRYTLLIAVVIIVAMVFFNYSRNSRYYGKVYGVDNPITMQLGEMKRYAGEPFRASIACCSVLAGSQADRIDADLTPKEIILPGFLIEKGRVPRELEIRWYHRYVDVDDSLTTNSAFLDIMPVLGAWAIPFIGFVSLMMGIAAAWLPRHGFLPTLSAGAITYGFAELWRIYLFNQGILIFLIGLPLLVVFASRFWISERGAGRSG